MNQEFPLSFLIKRVGAPCSVAALRQILASLLTGSPLRQIPK
jgi:hypothetical protein